MGEAVHLRKDQPTREGLSINMVGVDVARIGNSPAYFWSTFDTPLPGVTLHLAKIGNHTTVWMLTCSSKLGSHTDFVSSYET
jgi:hypothetical protein